MVVSSTQRRVTTKQIPTGRLHEIKADYELKGGWLKMPMDEVLFNPRLTGKSVQLWGWLAAAKSMSDNSIVLPSWQACELKMQCGVTVRRRCLTQLIEEGFISVSADGKIVTMHDPVKVYKKQRKAMADEICRECSKLRDEPEVIQPVIIDTPKVEPKKEPVDERQVIIDAWNSCKPASYSKIRVLSTKQKECVYKHLNNLGLSKNNINEFICSVCRGLSRSEFWIRKIDDKSKSFNTVFGYGTPSDTKMKNIENLYIAGEDAPQDLETKQAVFYTDEQQELIDQIKSIEYQISMNNPEDDYVQRFFDQRDDQIEQLRKLGINWEEV